MPTCPDTEQLLHAASGGNRRSIDALFERFRERLLHSIAVRFDGRLRARIDAEDVLQEALVEANRRLHEYLRERRVHFYVWLRGIVIERLVDAQRRHVFSQKRSVKKEEHAMLGISNDSACELVGLLKAPGTSPSQRLIKEETIASAKDALESLNELDREALVLRYLEKLSIKEASEVLQISENAFTKRHIRAIQRMRRLLQHVDEED